MIRRKESIGDRSETMASNERGEQRDVPDVKDFDPISIISIVFMYTRDIEARLFARTETDRFSKLSCAECAYHCFDIWEGNPSEYH